MLSFGGLLNLILTGGSPGLTASNPGLTKVLGGFVFPIGLVMWVSSRRKLCDADTQIHRIVLLGLELLTSNMMVRHISQPPDNWSNHVPARYSQWLSTKEPFLGGVSHWTGLSVSPYLVLLTARRSQFLTLVTFGNLVGSLFFAAIIVKCNGRSYEPLWSLSDPYSIQTAALFHYHHGTPMFKHLQCKRTFVFLLGYSVPYCFLY